TSYRVGTDMLCADWRLMRAEVDRRTHLQAYDSIAGDEVVTNVNRILQVRQEDALLDGEAPHLVPPNRQSLLQAKFRQVIGAVQIERSAFPLLAAEVDGRSIGQPEHFRQMIQHDLAAQRRRECRDQQAMVTARSHP